MKLPERNLAQEMLAAFCRGYKNRDLPGLLKLFAENVHLWGSGRDEYRIGLKQVEEQLKRDWSQSEKAEIEILSFVPTPKNALWAAAFARQALQLMARAGIFRFARHYHS